MNILITGGTGFIGQRLAIECLSREQLDLSAEPSRTGSTEIEKIVLADVAEPALWHKGLQDHAKVESRFGDIVDARWVDSLFDNTYDVVFHLASIVSGHGEQDFDLALNVNLDGTRYLFENIRAQNNNARVVFTSSLAAFGGDDMHDSVGDNTKQTPQTTYGATKAIGELLINDYSRKGFFDGRSARLPTVIVRPGKPNLAASSFVSGLFREPLAGVPCKIPVEPDQKMPVLGYRSIVDGIIKLAEIPATELGTDRGVGLPALNVTVKQMIAALKNAAGNRHLGEHVFEHDKTIAEIVSGWPLETDNHRALKLGLPLDNALEDVVQHYIEDYIDGQSA